MKEARILIVDDNRNVLNALKMLLKYHCKLVHGISNPNNLLTELRKDNYDVILLDMNFKAGQSSGNEGLYWLSRIIEADPSVSVIMITAYGEVELAVRAVKMGATDFVLKPWDNDKLLATIQSAYRLRLSNQKVNQLQEKEKELVNQISQTSKKIIGQSAAIKKVLDMVAKVAGTDANVLITGENGTGKDLVAREIHRLSKRKDNIIVHVDMGAIPESLFESELFGYKKGAFTGADKDKAGKFEIANGGTLFLDEIGNLTPQTQSKLLQVIQNRIVTRLGHAQPIDIDIRLICATNANLDKMIDEGEFREDLMYRINTITIEMPPLRERGSDILLLAEFFLMQYAGKYGKGKLELSEGAKKKLMSYEWPGNIRELQHSIEKAVILGTDKIIKPEGIMLRPPKKQTGSTAPSTLEDLEKKAILSSLERMEGNISAVANELGVTRQTLYNKLKKYDIDV